MKLHAYRIDALGLAIFDEADNLIVDCNAGEMTDENARRIVASWNAMRHLTVEQIEAAHAIDADWHNHLCEWIGDAALNEIKKRYEKSRAKPEVV